MAPRAAPCSDCPSRPALPCPAPQTVAAGRQQVQWAGVCPGRPTLPCPCLVCHHRQTDRQTPLLLLYIGLSYNKNHGKFHCD